MFNLPNSEQVDGQQSTRISTSDNARLDVRATLAVLRRRQRTIIATAAAFVLIAALVIASLPTRYTATTQILIEPTNLRVVDKSVIDSSRLSDTAISQVESQTQVLVSNTVLRRVVEKESLVADAEFNGTQSGFLSSGFNILRAAFAFEGKRNSDRDLFNTTLDDLRRRITVKRQPQTFVVDLSVASVDPEKSARLTNAIAQAYLDEQAAAQSTTARRVFASLSGRLDSLRETVRAAEEKVEQFKREHQIVVSAGELMTESEATQLSSQLVLARARTAAAKARYEQARLLQSRGLEAAELPDAVQSQAVALLREQYAAAARREAALAASLGAQHPDLIRARSELAKARDLVTDEVERLVKSRQSDYERAVADEASLSKSVDEMKAKILKLGDAAVQLRELERDAQAKRNVYESLAVRSREVGAQEWIDSSNVRVISVATVPRKPSFPPPASLLLAAALVLGLGAGAGVAVTGEKMDRRESRDGNIPTD